MWSAGRGEVVDVGVAAGGTVGLGVVCLAAVAGHRAAGKVHRRSVARRPMRF